jgi:hypothetical protein
MLLKKSFCIRARLQMLLKKSFLYQGTAYSRAARSPAEGLTALPKTGSPTSRLCSVGCNAGA